MRTQIYIGVDIGYINKEKGNNWIQERVKGSDPFLLILSITFKENCPDIRNSRVIDVINELKEFQTVVDVYDPWADAKEVKKEYNVPLIQSSALNIHNYNAVILAVAHDKFKAIDFKLNDNQVLYDIKSFINNDSVDGKL